MKYMQEKCDVTFDEVSKRLTDVHDVHSHSDYRK